VIHRLVPTADVFWEFRARHDGAARLWLWQLDALKPLPGSNWQ